MNEVSSFSLNIKRLKINSNLETCLQNVAFPAELRTELNKFIFITERVTLAPTE